MTSSHDHPGSIDGTHAQPAGDARDDSTKPRDRRAATTSRVWFVLIVVNAALIAANHPRAVRYLDEVRPDAGSGSLTAMSYNVGAALALAVATGVCLLYYSLAAQLDRVLWPGVLLEKAGVRIGHFALVAALSTTVPNTLRLVLGELRLADRPLAAAAVFTLSVCVPCVLSRARLSSAPSRRRLTVLALSALLPALIIYG